MIGLLLQDQGSIVSKPLLSLFDMFPMSVCWKEISLSVRIVCVKDTVERFGNCHLGDRGKWPFQGGGGCEELKIRLNVSVGTNKSDRCREDSLSEGSFQCTAIIIKGQMCSFVIIFSLAERKKRVVAE